MTMALTDSCATAQLAEQRNENGSHNTEYCVKPILQLSLRVGPRHGGFASGKALTLSPG